MKKITREAILWYALQTQGDWFQIAYSIRDKDDYKIVHYRYPYITILDPDYPSCFLRLRYPPWILFYQGDLSYLNLEGIGIVGSRNCTAQAIKDTQTVAEIVKKKYVVVSGLASGVDAMAHRCALDRKTIGFIGCGIDRIYPKSNTELYQIMRKDHLIVSEYPMGVLPLSKHFPWRNRLIAACSKSLIVIQAKYKSGTMHTVKQCLELSKTVYCLPSAFSDTEYQGCNYLIQSGAQIIVNQKDLEEL